MNNSKKNENHNDYSTLRAGLDAAPHTHLERVEVNQRALIDKILARYATASAVYRELLQNSNDASASVAEIDFTASTEDHKKVVTQVVYRNNGLPFRPQDWDRLQKIAEGNPDVSKVGAFGVGAYTMFSVAEEPVIVSGNQVLVFIWKGDALYTKKATTDHQNNIEKNPWTTFVLPSRDPYPLPDWNEFGEFLTAALTFTNALRTIRVSVNGVEILKIEKTILMSPRPVQAHNAKLASSTSKASFLWNALTSKSSSNKLQSSTGLFSLPVSSPDAITESLVRVTVTIEQTAMASMDAQYVQATVHTHIPQELQRRMQRVTKKDPPAHCTVQVFLNYNQPTAKLIVEGGNNKNNSISTTSARRAQQMAQSFAPVAGQGRIFIGFRTSQTTGLAAHVAAPFVPTVEREAMDLQDVVLRQFNTELLECAGMLLRLTLEHTMRNRIDASWRSNQVEREALDAKAWKQWQLARERNKQSTSQSVGEEENIAIDSEDAVSSSSSTGTMMNFARFMAK